MKILFQLCARGVDSVASYIAIDEQLQNNRDCYFHHADYAFWGLSLFLDYFKQLMWNGFIQCLIQWTRGVLTRHIWRQRIEILIVKFQQMLTWTLYTWNTDLMEIKNVLFLLLQQILLLGRLISQLTSHFLPKIYFMKWDIFKKKDVLYV